MARRVPPERRRGLLWMSSHHLYIAPHLPKQLCRWFQAFETMVQTGVGEKPLEYEAGWFLPKPFPPELAAAYPVPRSSSIGQPVFGGCIGTPGTIAVVSLKPHRATAALTPLAALPRCCPLAVRSTHADTSDAASMDFELDRDGHQWILWSASTHFAFPRARESTGTGSGREARRGR
jgi:hypothetical protein